MALIAFEDEARTYEHARARKSASFDSGGSNDSAMNMGGMGGLRKASATLINELRREAERPSSPLSSELTTDLERWVDGEFSGSNADIELANHAIFDLLGSDVVAEIGVSEG
ncbi:MAG: hypothetical protein NVS3B20_00010 [Polyangiales bacterium]